MLGEEKKEYESIEEDDDSSPVKAKKNVFVHSDEHVWLPARILEQTGNGQVRVQVFDLSGTTREETVHLADYAPQNALPLKNVKEYGDMIDLPFLHEPGILYNLRTRFLNNRPYTRTGDILIAVNPYQWLNDLYTIEKRRLYMPETCYDDASGMVKKSVPPHVYEVAAMAYRGLAVEQRNQSILVSGESGAGKTETVKICLDHIATIQGGLKRGMSLSNPQQQKQQQHQVMSSIVQRVVDSNPLLEAFGNAKTVRNDNSSRFGKFVQLQFGQSINSCTLVGSHIEVYLLEKSRVISHAAGERNFHIFYQLLAAPDNIKRKIDPDILLRKTPASFPYLGSRDQNGMKVKRRRSFVGHSSSSKNDESQLIESMSDAQWFEQTIRELEIIGIQGETLWDLLRALCVVLQLGTIDFVPDESDRAQIPSKQTIKGGDFYKLAHLMGIDIEILVKAFTNKTIMAGTTEISSPLTPQQAKEGCDAYAKDLYSKTFLWLVGTINAATSASSKHAHAKNRSLTSGGEESSAPEHGMIGVLDIFGFEAFETNHFEQLCINYANERLQYMFASNVFVSLIDEYSREGLVVDFTYETNTNVLDLIAGKVGILATLNEECIRPGGSDIEFVFKALQQNKQSPRMFKTDLFTRYQFGIRHFAGPVVYTAKEFLSTNKDIIPIDLQKVSRLSANTIVASDPCKDSSGPVHRSRSNMVKNTVSSKFRTQLNSLMKSLSNTRTHYIRCIKPNRMKQPQLMENFEIMRQLSSGGVIAAIKIASASYPNKMEHHAVLKRFRNLGQKPDPSHDVKVQVTSLLEIALKQFVSPIKGGTPRPPVTVGNTRTYFRMGALEHLENARNDNIGFFAIIIQRSYRMFPVQRSFHIQRNAAIVIQAKMRGYVWKRRCERMPSCALLIQCWLRCMLARKRLKQHKSAVRIQQQWCTVREVLRLRRRIKAVISIQKNVKAWMQREKYKEELFQKSKAAVQVQKIARRWIQLANYSLILEQKRLHRLHAAVQIQKLLRGCQQRIKFRTILEEHLSKKIASAICLQRFARLRIQMAKFHLMKKAEQEQAARETSERASQEDVMIAANYAQEEDYIATTNKVKKVQLKSDKRQKTEKQTRLIFFDSQTHLDGEKMAPEKLSKKLDHKRAPLSQNEHQGVVKQTKEFVLDMEMYDVKKTNKTEAASPVPPALDERRMQSHLNEDKAITAEIQTKEKKVASDKQCVKEGKLNVERSMADIMLLEERLAAAEKRAEAERLKAERSASRNADLELRIYAMQRELQTVPDDACVERAIQEAQAKAAADNAVKEEPDKDEELELALEMALLAGQNPDLPVEELNKLLGKPTLNEESSTSTFLSRLSGGFHRMVTAPSWATTPPAGVVISAPWGASDPHSLGHYLSSSASRIRGGSRDDDTYAESVLTMMLPDSLTAEQLRLRRRKLKEQQAMRKLSQRISRESRELRQLQARGDKTQASNREKNRVLIERYSCSKCKWEKRIDRLPYDDREVNIYTKALEEASIQLGLGSFEDQKETLCQEGKLQLEIQILQESQLVRQMQHLHVIGQQKFLHKKHAQREMEYLKSCKTWLSDHTVMQKSVEEMQELLQEMKTLYSSTLRRQEAAFARHDADMTIRESIEDIF